MFINFEFKARCRDLTSLENKLRSCHPQFAGTDHQVDTYFRVANGRMKLREGTIEHALIHYNRSNIRGAKQSEIILYHPNPDGQLKALLTRALGILIVVDKIRRIYFIENVKFHFDEVKELGSFVEVEAIDRDGSIGIEKLKDQCNGYARLLGVADKEYVAASYSDMLLEKISSNP